MIDDLIGFLRTQLDKDEQAAKAMQSVYPTPWDVSDRGHSARVVADEPNFFAVVSIDQNQAPAAEWLSDVVGHVQRWNPDRVLADVAAKRRIIELHEPTYPPGGPIYGVHWEHVHVRGANGEITGDREFAVENSEPDPPDWCNQCANRCAPCPTLRLVAMPYADHPDYREEWRP